MAEANVEKGTKIAYASFIFKMIAIYFSFRLP